MFPDHRHEFLTNNNWVFAEIYKYIASSLNDGRNDLLRMISNIPIKLPDMVLCTYKDRVARFGTKLLEQICSIYDLQLVEARVKEVSEVDPLVHSIIAIFTSFSCKSYISRRGRINEIPTFT